MKLLPLKFKSAKQYVNANNLNKPFLEVIKNGRDVLLNRPIGGGWAGYTFSEMSEDYEGRRLLSWIYSRSTFEDDIKKIAGDILEENSYI